MRAKQKLSLTALLAITAVSLAACGSLNRAASLNQTTQVSGAAAAGALQRHLAGHGFPNARVNCARSLVVNVGTLTSCSLTGAGAKGTVWFTFRNSTGEIDPASVKPS